MTGNAAPSKGCNKNRANDQHVGTEKKSVCVCVCVCVQDLNITDLKLCTFDENVFRFWQF
jgi:hypothetical protein